MIKKIALVVASIIVAGAIISIPIGISISKKLHIENMGIILNKEGQSLKILQISDIHYPLTNLSMLNLINKVQKEKPHLIFLTGDIIDSSTKREDITALLPLFRTLSKYPTYAVLGNHETINSSLKYYKSLLAENNIILLENDFQRVNIEGKEIIIVGLSDKYPYSQGSIKNLNTLLLGGGQILLLAHRPEKWEEYIGGDFPPPSITFAGHAHGGMVRIFGKGLYSPSQGVFPKYSSGLYKNKKDKGYFMVVSRGLGDGTSPHRFFNKYHLPVVEVRI